MLGRIAGVIIIISVFFGVTCGNFAQMGAAVMDGAADAVELTVALVGMMCLWCGVLRVLREAGAVSALARLLRPVLRLFFPEAARHPEIAEDIAANIAANMLGVGNAATPMALSAMKKLKELDPSSDRASADMITLAVLNTSSISLVPSTLLTLLRAAGSRDPFAVILPIWITSVTCATLALSLCRVMALVTGISRERKEESELSQRQAMTWRAE